MKADQPLTPQLTVCVPLYRQRADSLAEALTQQACGLPVEILFLDDGSGPVWDIHLDELATLPSLRLERLTNNAGRAAVRNQLAQRARGTWLLFLDGDSELVSPDFIRKYLAELPFEGVICGGRIYPPKVEKELVLHHVYGTSQESRPASLRAQSPYRSFMTNNFLVSAAYLRAHPFEERLRQYGHEDTLFGFFLKKNEVPIRHIDNPVRHGVLEPGGIFLEKTRQALRNLIFLTQLMGAERHPFEQSVRLLHAAARLRRLGLRRGMGKLFVWVRQRLEKYLTTAERPSVFWFQVYKLGYFCAVAENEHV